ncbi:UNVERIFIED_ORG: hypothetical protein BDU10_2536 [Burkholderia sp. CF145]
MDNSVSTMQSRIDEGVTWMEKNDPQTLAKLAASDSDMQLAIKTANKLGEKDGLVDKGELDGDSVSLAKARFMSETLKRMQPIILGSAKEATKRSSRARHFKAYASIATTLFSAATLSLVSLVASVKAAVWTAVGSTLAALCTLFSDYVGRIGDGDKPVTAALASSQLIDLNYDASLISAELDAHIALGSVTHGLLACVNEANAVCKQANALAGLLGKLDGYSAPGPVGLARSTDGGPVKMP